MSIQRTRSFRYSVRGAVPVDVSLSVAVSADPDLEVLTTLIQGTINSALSVQLQAQGGSGVNYRWARTGNLPDGLSLTRDGLVSGTPTIYGIFGLPIVVTDSNGNQATDTITINIAPAALTLSLPTFPEGKVGDNYLHPVGDIVATGGVQPTVISVKSGSLPAGLATLQTGVGRWRLAGTPTERAVKIAVFRVTDSASVKVSATTTIGITASVASTVTVTLTAGTVTLTVPPYINQAPVWSSTMPTLYTGTVGVSAVLVNLSTYVVDPEGSALTYTIENGSVPGLTLSAGKIKGTGTSAGTYSLVVGADDNAIQPLGVVTSVLPTVNLSSAFDYTLVSEGGTGTKTWSLLSALPTWATLSAGKIQGIALTVSAYPFTVRVTDGATSTADKALTLTVQSPPTDDFAARAANTLYATNFLDVYHSGVIVPAKQITSTTGLHNEAYWGLTVPSGQDRTAKVSLAQSPTTGGQQAMCITSYPEDGANSGGWRQSADGRTATVYQRIYAQVAFYYPKDFLGWRYLVSSGSNPVMKIMNCGQYGSGQVTLYHYRSTGFPAIYINGSNGASSWGSWAGNTLTGPPFNDTVYRLHKAVDAGGSGATKSDLYTRYGPIIGSSQGINNDQDLTYNAAVPLVYNRTQPSGWPDTRCATNGLQIYPDDWTVIQLFLEYKSTGSTMMMWGARKGDAPRLLLDYKNVVPISASTANSWRSFELQVYDTERQPEANRPIQRMYFGELITSLVPIRFPGQTTLPPGNLG